MKSKSVGLTVLFLLSLGLCAAQSSTLNIGMVFDPAGKYDHAINQAANDGAEKAAVDFGVSVSSYAPMDAADAARQLGSYAQSNALVIGVGKFNNAGVSKLAARTPNVHFAVVDDLPGGSNTMGIRFRENEGAFMAGYIAATATSTNVVGILAPSGSPASVAFVAAYRAGVKLICPSCQVLVGAVNGTAADVTTATAEALSKKMLQQGADMLFVGASAGKVGVIGAVRSQQCLKQAGLPAGVTFHRDVFAKVPRGADYVTQCGTNSRPVFFIGWESDYLALGDTDADPATLNTGLTAVVKRADTAVYSLIRDEVKKRPWRSGENGFGFQNGGLEVTVNKYNAALLDQGMMARLKKVEGLIANGSLNLTGQ